jgi:hypothetical protein
MIIAPTPSFYVIRATGEAAEMIAAVFSPGAMGDITDVIVLSQEFTNDIEPMNEMDASLATIKEGLSSDLIENVQFNPLYIPMSLDDLDDALVIEQKSDQVQFSAMNGNPFAVKIVEISNDEEPLITATVSYQQFDLPGYETIMSNQKNLVLN